MKNSTHPPSKKNSNDSKSNRLKFYFDEHIGKAIAKASRQKGIEVVRAEEIGNEGLTDPEHLAYAHRQGRVVFTKIARYLELLWQVMSPDEMAGRVEYAFDPDG